MTISFGMATHYCTFHLQGQLQLDI